MSTLLDQLRELHRLLRFVRDLDDNLGRIPRQRKAYQAKLARTEQTLREEQEALKLLKVNTSSKEKTLKSKGDQIAKWELKFNEVTNKKEFDALKLEIAHARDASAQLEEEILSGLSEIDERTQRMPNHEKAVVQVREEINKFEADVVTRETAWKEELAKAKLDLKQFESQIPEDYRDQYNRTVSSKGADSLACVRGQLCTACNTEMHKNMYLQLLTGRFTVCKSCGRILYTPAEPSRKAVEDD